MANVGTSTIGLVLQGSGNGLSPTFKPIGLNSGLTAHGLVIAQGAGAFTATGVGTATQVLTSNGPGLDPTFQTIAAGGVTSVSGVTNRSTATPTTGNVVVDISAAYVGQSSITTLGTISTGVWNGTLIGPTFGGTGQSTYTTGDILYASATNTLSKLPIGSSTNVLTVTGGVPVWAAASVGGTYVGGVTSWTDVTGTTQAMAINSGYLSDNVSRVTLTLPSTAAQFTVIRVCGNGAGGWTIAQNAGQNIQFGQNSSTVGVTGSVKSTNRYDTVELLCTVANTTWNVISYDGNITTA